MTEPVWVEYAVVLAMHDEMLVAHGGSPGIRDTKLLESALARPRQIYAYVGCDIVDLAAAYTAGIVRNHPFVDGNKRTGFMTGYVFLIRNGLTLTADDPAVAEAVLELAAGTIDESGFAMWLRDNVKRPKSRAKSKRSR